MFLLLFLCWFQTDPIRVVLHSGTVLRCAELQKVDETWSVITLADGFEAPAPYVGVRKFKIRNHLINWQETWPEPAEAEVPEASKRIQIDQAQLEKYAQDHPRAANENEIAPPTLTSSQPSSEPKPARSPNEPLVYEPNRIYERPQDMAGQEEMNRMFQIAFDDQMREVDRREADLQASFERYSASTYNVSRGYVSAYNPEYYWSLVVADRHEYETEFEKATRIAEDARKSGAKLNRPSPEKNQRLLREIDRNQ
ncbi:MAG: hypothetical protein H6510_15315 [Acidobacteria bacterium]|nr:hypothetical protein [Acidobacteriota bacterium]MCB9399184.1 hypothetical protein [Acidobacteriota bacterium]